MGKDKCKDAFKRLRWLIGKWKAVEGKVTPPGQRCTPFLEEFTLQPAKSSPFLRFKSFGWHPETKEPLFGERGFAFVKPGTTNISFALTNSRGVVTLEEGCFGEGCLEVTSMGVANLEGAQAMCIKRQYRFCGGRLEIVIYMSKSAQDPCTLGEYLRAKYKKEDNKKGKC